MKLISYYSYADPFRPESHACSRESSHTPLLVNCAGSFVSSFPFTTDNPAGRLDYYLLYVASGTLTVGIHNRLQILHPGDAVIFPPHYHYYYTFDGKGEALNYLWVHFTGSHAGSYLNELGLGELPRVSHASADAHIPSAFRSLFDIFSRESAHRELSLAAALLQLITTLSEAVSSTEPSNPIARSLQYINASYTDDIQIPTLAAMENLSNSRYHVVFKETVGLSPRAYITMLRMRHACELLSNTDLTVRQIGALVGYDDSHFFCKVFKSKMGLSPSLYRKEGAGNT